MNIPPCGYPAKVNDHLSYIHFGTTLENSTINILIYVSCEQMDSFLLDKYPQVNFLQPASYFKSFSLTLSSWGWLSPWCLVVMYLLLSLCWSLLQGVGCVSSFSFTPPRASSTEVGSPSTVTNRKSLWVKRCVIMNTAQLNPIFRSGRVVGFFIYWILEKETEKMKWWGHKWKGQASTLGLCSHYGPLILPAVTGK